MVKLHQYNSTYLRLIYQFTIFHLLTIVTVNYFLAIIQYILIIRII